MEPGNEQYLGGFPLTIDQDTLTGTFGGNITIPGNAALGPHSVAFMLPGDTDPACLTFTVAGAGDQPSASTPPATIIRLPETGLNASSLTALVLVLATGMLVTIRGRS